MDSYGVSDRFIWASDAKQVQLFDMTRVLVRLIVGLSSASRVQLLVFRCNHAAYWQIQLLGRIMSHVAILLTKDCSDWMYWVKLRRIIVIVGTMGEGFEVTHEPPAGRIGG